MIKTILRKIIIHCAGTQDIIKKLFSCGTCGRKSGMKTVAFLLRLSIYTSGVGRSGWISMTSLLIWIYIIFKEQWISGSVLDLRLRGCRFEPKRLHCGVSLSKTH